MQAWEFIQQYPQFRQALVAAVAIGTLCSLLSVVAVLKRMTFIGQGISHAGFGGVGTAVFLGLSGISQDLVIFGFCLLTAFAIAILSRSRRLEPDSAIGILLVAAMSWGVLMVNLASQLQQSEWYVNLFGVQQYRPSFEAILFGSLLSVTRARMWMAVIACVGVLLTCGALYKEMLFFCFDEPVSRVFGVRTTWLHHLLLVLLAVTIVLTMMLAGVVLVSALLVIPGATALQLARRMGPVLAWAWLIGLIGTVGGLLLSLELGHLPTGPCIVGVLCLLFGLVYSGKWVAQRWAGSPSASQSAAATLPVE